MLSERAINLLKERRASNTMKAYQSDWRQFCVYCKRVGADCMPASVDTLANYLAELATTHKAASIQRKVSSIRAMHSHLQDNPADSPLIRAITTNILRCIGTAQRQAVALTADNIKKICDTATESMLDIRNKALILIGYAGALRRSELVGLRLADITTTSKGIILTLERSKTDQLGHGAKIAIPRTGGATCPVSALQNWLDRAGITNGYIFRGITAKGEIKDTHLDDRMVSLVVKHYCELIGLDPDNYSGHSLRRGYATSAAKLHATPEQIMRQTRHRSLQMVLRYIDEAELFEDMPNVLGA